LREAFAGHLVPQDPNDEPASVLLDRIRAASDAEMTKPKVKRMPKSKTKPAKRPLLQVLREHKKPMTVENLFRESGYESLLSESDEPQDVVDAFYGELREHTAKPAKISQQRDSKGQALLRALS
jgi:vancomycin resistance protein YoaR